MSSPSTAPQLLTRATPAYRRKLARLLLDLLGLALTYLVLLTGCTAAVVVVVLAAIEDPRLWLLAALVLPCCLPLGAFLLGVFGRRPLPLLGGRELDALEYPHLWAFLSDLAGRARAPMPERVRVVPGVNAAMLRAQGRRELIVGLGLVNVLELREFEAVLAHEFGHFAQSSTRAGQWAHALTMGLRGVVGGRTRLDLRLSRARRSSSVLLRGGAAVLAMGVEGARGLLRWRLTQIIRSNQAFARELEFNADLHAVALCGSDALVSALWKAQRGALAMNHALAGLAELTKHGLFSEDVYHHHRARLDELDERLRESGHPMAQALATPYDAGPQLHFPPGEAPAEIMWYAHPSYRERELNAKHSYVPPLERAGGLEPAWSLFGAQAQPGSGLRRIMSLSSYEEMGRVTAPGALRPAQELEQRLEAELAERRQDPRYHGFYDNRLVELGELDELVAQVGTELETGGEGLEQLVREGRRWRGAPLAAFMQRWMQTQAQLDARVEPSERARLERERAEQRSEAEDGDRAIFAWMWAWADLDQRTQLLERHGFGAWVQIQIVFYNTHHAELQRLLRTLDAGTIANSEDAPAELLEALERLRAMLLATLSEAEGLSLPALSNLEQGASVRAALGKGSPPTALEPGQALGPWFAALTRQVAEVHGRLRTLHYKNLGALLRLYEEIEAGGGPNDQSAHSPSVR